MQATQDNITPINPLPNTSKKQKRKKLFSIFAIVIALCAISGYAYWKLYASKHVTTDNAYTAADIAEVAASIGGIVKSVIVIDTQTVKTGQPLVYLDDTDTKLALQQAQAVLARSEAELQRIQLNFDRRQKLSHSGFISKEELTNSESALNVAKANISSATANVQEARINLDRTVIRAPINGVIAKRDVQLGQRIAVGAHMLSIIPMSQIYVNANFKEVQLTRVKVGQPVTLHADIYGSHVVYHGRVVGVAGGTGSAFAIIPAQNATGNWIKVVQRLPVRIALNSKELAKHPLEVGLSMRADIHIG